MPVSRMVFVLPLACAIACSSNDSGDGLSDEGSRDQPIVFETGVWQVGRVSATGESWYSFVAPETGPYSFRIYDNAEDRDLGWEVLDPEDSSISFSGAIVGVVLEEINARSNYIGNLTQDDTYLVRISNVDEGPYDDGYGHVSEGESNATPFQLRIDREGRSEGSVEDPVSVDLNADLNLALDCPGLYAGNSEPYSVYSFEATAETLYLYRTGSDFDSSTDYAFELLSADGASLGPLAEGQTLFLEGSDVVFEFVMSELSLGETYLLRLTHGDNCGEPTIPVRIEEAARQ